MPTWAGWLYLAVVIDVFSRRVAVWHIAEHLRTELMRIVLDQAIGERCREADIRPSTGSAGDCFDNAMAQSLFATLKCEWLKPRTPPRKAEGCRALFQFIEDWYNPRRRHSALGQRSPVEIRTLVGPNGERLSSQA